MRYFLGAFLRLGPHEFGSNSGTIATLRRFDWTFGRRLRGFQKGGKESFPMPTAWPVGERALGFGQRTGLFGDPVLD
jgi:hypothetical protein